MSINILMPCDIEDEIRFALKDYLTIYCRPLPDNFTVPSLLVRATGGQSENTIDTFQVVIDARAKTDAEASELIRKALGVLEAQTASQTGALRNITVNSMANWGSDPVRPDLKLCTMTVLVTAHRESLTINNRRR
jgi:hypothetical protein